MASILETHSNNNNNWTIANINHRFGDACALCSMSFLNFAKRSYDKWMIGQRTMNRVNKPGYLKICDCKLSIQNRSHQINLSSHRIGHIIYSPQSASPYCLLECRSKIKTWLKDKQLSRFPFLIERLARQFESMCARKWTPPRHGMASATTYQIQNALSVIVLMIQLNWITLCVTGKKREGWCCLRVCRDYLVIFPIRCICCVLCVCVSTAINVSVLIAIIGDEHQLFVGGKTIKSGSSGVCIL